MPRLDDFDDASLDAYLDENDQQNDRRNRRRSRWVRTRRLTEEARERRSRTLADAIPELPDDADRWTTWDDAERGPEPYPRWLPTELAAVDRELGVLKTGKEADVHLIRRYVPDTDRGCLLAAKRYRDSEHRLFHRDASYLEGRRARKSREARAMANRSNFGRNLLAERWAAAEFAALKELWAAGACVPYPAQRMGTEMLLEFVGTPNGAAAPRLAETRPDRDQLAQLWDSLVDSLLVLARNGYTHGDLSPFNVLVADPDTDASRLVLIDLPQVVDVVSNPRGLEFLARDVRTISAWFTTKGLTVDADELLGWLSDEAGVGAP